jgi:nitroreductase
MSFAELVARRYSVRAYKGIEVEPEKLQCVLEVARMAPTAANRQPFRIFVLRTAGRAAELKRVYHQDWFGQAPLVLCVCGVAAQSWTRRDGQSYLWVDAAIVMDHLILAAADLGLGTCWIANFDPVAARKLLRLPDDAEPIAFTPLGYPADVPGPKDRKTTSELVRFL